MRIRTEKKKDNKKKKDEKNAETKMNQQKAD